MFAKVFGSILFSVLLATSSAESVEIADGDDRSVVTKQVVRLAKACPANAVREYCTVDVQAYSGYNSTTCNGANEGFVKLNGKTVWSAGWCSSLDNVRGITIVDVDTHSCTANNVLTFDTHANESNSVALSTYLQQLPPGAVIVGVSGDDPTSKLAPALETLKSLRVDVRDVQERGNFAFVLQKDYSFEPIVAKGLNINVPPATINARLEEECRILLQQHFGSASFFNRPRADYVTGFGDETSNYWMGLERIHNLTWDGNFKLRAEVLARVDSQWYWAEYTTFEVMDDTANYVLWVNGYSGTAGDALIASSGSKFSTKDRDVDSSCGTNCAQDINYGYNSGFWYASCGNVFINTRDDVNNGFTWYNLPLVGPIPAVYKLSTSRLYLVANV